MPKKYFQCSKCKTPASVKAKSGGSVQMKCSKCNILMTFRGDGYDGRKNWPHGKPASFGKPASQLQLFDKPSNEQLQNSSKIVIYTDGACSPNPGLGGWAAILQFKKNGKLYEREITGNDENTTNNRMEMMAVLKGLVIIKRPCDVIVYTDSKYVQNGIGDWCGGRPTKKGWMVGWRKRGWTRPNSEPLLNVDLWQSLYEQARRHTKITIKHVKGHVGDELNERCDILAVESRKLLI